jgi:large subunit ribosomal protein L32
MLLHKYPKYGKVSGMSIRMRHTSSHTRNRRSHHALKNRVIVKDKESGALRLPHRLDETTGMYRGKQILPKKEVKAEVKDHKKRVEAHKHEHPDGAKQPLEVKNASPKAMKKKTLGKSEAKAEAAG